MILEGSCQVKKWLGPQILPLILSSLHTNELMYRNQFTMYT